MVLYLYMYMLYEWTFYFLDTVRFALTISIETYKKFSQLVSTSNKRPSSGEMKKDQKRVDIYREMDFTSAILKHCMEHHHPLPSINNFTIIDKDSSQVTQEAKEAIHIRRLDPSLNWNIGKMSIPHCFDPLIRAKPK